MTRPSTTITKEQADGDVLFRKDVRWDLDISNWSQREIQQYYVADEEWQEFRESLKGHSTMYKLRKLKDRYIALCASLPPVYVANAEWTPEQKDSWNRRKCQIDNYINALKRSGTIDRNGYIKRP